jgi:hypothetical protein
MMAETKNEEHLQFSIAKALLYSDIFSYPLTADEIFFRLTTNHTCIDEVKKVLGTMKSEGTVFQFGNFFSIRNDEALEQRRMTGNQRANAILPRALKRGRLLGKFPFIRAVMISGSLSKSYMDKESDIDYFVITHPGRLWIARFFVAVFKRIFLFNSHKHFCVNYYVDQESLEIEEKNIFTATELVSLIPVCGSSYEDLIKRNSWVRDYFPNSAKAAAASVPGLPMPWWKKMIEHSIHPFGDTIDKWILAIAFQRYRRLYAHIFTASDFSIAFKSKRGVSKNHDRNYQKYITEMYHTKVECFAHDHRRTAIV